MLGEGMEWDSDTVVVQKIVVQEHLWVKMANEYPNDFCKPAVTEPNENIDDTTKEEYQKYALSLKAEKESIRLESSQISNELKSLKQSYVKDC